MLPRRPYNPTAYDDDWEGQPAQSGFHKWVPGVVFPLFMLGNGIRAIVMHEASFGRYAGMPLHGSNAIAYGIAWVCAGSFVHWHYFWGNLFDQIWFALLGKIISAIGVIASLGYILIRVGILNRQH